MEKLKMQTPNKTEQNIEQIAQLFPNVVTEMEDENGEIIRGIDFDLLKQQLSDVFVDDHTERYRLDWPGKRKSLLKANTPLTKTLRPCREESVNFDTTENLYLEGDNFEVLKILQESYLNKVKMIYIDPPYNTGKDFVYTDKFKVGREEYEEVIGVYDEEGGRLFRNTDSNGRFHSDWLTMMYERLIVARDLLKEDGVIFISIDDIESNNIKSICNEIFGEENYITSFIWNCSTAGGIRPKFTSKTHEYIHCYAKNIDLVNTFYAPLSTDAIRQYNKEDNNGKYREKDFVFRNKSSNLNQKYLITCPDGEQVKPNEGYIYRYIKNTFQDALAKDIVVFKKTNTSPLLQKNNSKANWNIYIKKYLGDATGTPSTTLPRDIIHIYNMGTMQLQQLFNGKRVFENVKPVSLIHYLLKIITNNNDIILDFFSGSATTADAVMQLNAEDGGKRKFIMVQLPEKTDEKSEAYKAGYKTISDIGKERIRRAGNQILDEAVGNKGNIDIGFRVYKTDTTNMKDVYYHPEDLDSQTIEDLDSQTIEDLISNIKEDRTAEDLLTQVILDLGLELNLPIEVKKIKGNSVYFVQDNSLVACFDDEIDFTIIDEIAKTEPLKVVFKDASFKYDKDKINLEGRFKRLSPDTIIKVL